MTVNYDYYVPYFNIAINGQDFRYGMNVEVISVSITETINRADSFTFTVREHNPRPQRFASGELTWLDSHMFDELTRIQVEVGYEQNRAIKLKGKIMGMSVTFPEDGAPKLTVHGLSDYDELFRATRLKPFEDKTDSEIARELADVLHLKPDVEDTQVKHKLVSCEGATFAAILLERAKRLNFEVAVKFDSLVFRQPTYLTDRNPQLTLAWGRDLRSFTPTVSNRRMATRVDVRNTQTGRGGPKEALTGSATASQIPPVLGAKSGLAIAGKQFPSHKVLMTEQRLGSQAEATNVPRAELQRQALEYVTARGACIGRPDLAARKVVRLEGLGRRFSGSYYVTSTTHTIDASGYRTEFDAKRDALWD